MKSLPFYIPQPEKGYPFLAEPPRIVHCRQCPPGCVFTYLNQAIVAETPGNRGATIDLITVSDAILTGRQTRFKITLFVWKSDVK